MTQSVGLYLKVGPSVSAEGFFVREILAEGILYKIVTLLPSVRGNHDELCLLNSTESCKVFCDKTDLECLVCFNSNRMPIYTFRFA